MSSTDSKNNSIVITGAAGFIGSCLVSFLNSNGFDNLILVDEFERSDKLNNLHNKKHAHKIERDLFFEWLEETKPVIDFIFHLGARTDTTEFDYAVHQYVSNFGKVDWKHRSPRVGTDR